jgi:hypothetical protein
MFFQLGTENKRTSRDKKSRKKSVHVCLFIYARGAGQVTYADGQSSHISLTDHYVLVILPSMVRLRRLELAGIGLVQAVSNWLELARVGLDQIKRGKELQQLRIIRFIIVPSGRHCY